MTDPAGAADAFEQLLTERLRVLGADHPKTLITRHNLACWRKQQAETCCRDDRTTEGS